MLVLDLAEGDGFTVDGPAEIAFVRHAGRRIRIGVNAEKSTQVTRLNAKNKTPKNRNEQPTEGTVGKPTEGSGLKR